MLYSIPSGSRISESRARYGHRVARGLQPYPGGGAPAGASSPVRGPGGPRGVPGESREVPGGWGSAVPRGSRIADVRPVHPMGRRRLATPTVRAPPRWAFKGWRGGAGAPRTFAPPPLLCRRAAAAAMLSVRVPLATIVDPQQQQQQLQLSPLKGLSLADKENTVSTRAPGRGGGGPVGREPAPDHASPRSPRPSAGPACWPARPPGGSSRSPPSR